MVQGASLVRVVITTILVPTRGSYQNYSPQWRASPGLLGAPPHLDKNTHQTLVNYPSPGPLYSIPTSAVASQVSSSFAFLARVVSSSVLRYMRLGYPGAHAFTSLSRSSVIPIQNSLASSHECCPCQLGKHTRRPHPPSDARASGLFDLVHSDVWPSPVKSLSFETQFNGKIKIFQCDGAVEYVRLNAFCDFLDDKGIHLRISCPVVHEQNDRVEPFHRSLLNCIRTMLF
ncbi:hypothetical protein LIER_15060 [Lithospermum erythrorhizon]|uniref:Integrase catalytic domain-containing protein n=1 Tax=Lithospermum erythrorhizon TaxID=34254 RepID=A0AAV3Q1V0_LITER